MAPTIRAGDHFGYAIFNSNGIETIERFDLIVFEVKADQEDEIRENALFVFRVIALGGETIELKKGRVFINGEPIRENFAKIASEDDHPPFVVPEGEYFVLGDNRLESFDSRYWRNIKTVKRKNILGIVSNVIRKEDWEKGKRW